MAPPSPLPEWAILRPTPSQMDVSWEDANRQVQKGNRSMNYYELSFNDVTLKFTLEKFGSRPASGYAFFIALHGGGGQEGKEESYRLSNNMAWYDMATSLYRMNFKGSGEGPDLEKVDGAIYVALRGVKESWNLHFLPESYALIDKLITTLIQPYSAPLVDSNRIYLTGFSAGGDGAYRLAANLSDRFAAANMSAGHPGEVQFDNFAALPFRSQVGEKDDTIRKAGDRARDVVEANIKLDKLQDAAKTRTTEPVYPHDCFVYRQGRDNNGNLLDFADHNNWEGAEASNWWDIALKPQRENLQAWFDGNNGKVEVDSFNTNAILWLNSQVRNPVPSYVAWNLDSRPPRPELLLDPSTQLPRDKWAPKRFFYWLYIRDLAITVAAVPSSANSVVGAAAEKPKPVVVRASYDRANRSVQIDEPNSNVILLLNEAMFSLDQPVTVYSGPMDGTTKPVTVAVKRSEKVRFQTWEARGDRNLVFSVALGFEEKGGKGSGLWEVKSLDSLSVDEVTPGPVRALL